MVKSQELFKFWWAPSSPTTCLERLKAQWSNFVHIEAMSWPSIEMTNHS